MTHVPVTIMLVAGLALASARVDPQSAQTQTSGALRITVIGCVDRSVPAPTGTAGSAIAPQRPTKYVLTNITLAGDSAAGRGSRADVLTQAVKSYRLDDASAPVIAGHLGERVEVIGTLVNPARSSGDPAERSDPIGQASAPPTLRVDSLRTIASKSTACAS